MHSEGLNWSVLASTSQFSASTRRCKFIADLPRLSVTQMLTCRKQSTRRQKRHSTTITTERQRCGQRYLELSGPSADCAAQLEVR